MKLEEFNTLADLEVVVLFPIYLSIRVNLYTKEGFLFPK